MESIKENPEKSKWIGHLWLFLAILLFITSLFLISRLKTILADRGPVTLTEATTTENLDNSAVLGAFVGSKTGKSYYFPWCAAANRIKEANKVWFANKAEAEVKGYKPAGNCHGLK